MIADDAAGSVETLHACHMTLSKEIITYGPPWTDNILVLSPAWRTGGTATNSNWVIQPGVSYGSVAFPWSGPVCDMPAYARRSLENR